MILGAGLRSQLDNAVEQTRAESASSLVVVI